MSLVPFHFLCPFSIVYMSVEVSDVLSTRAIQLLVFLSIPDLVLDAYHAACAR